MNAPDELPNVGFSDYSRRLSNALREADWVPVRDLAESMLSCWREGRQLFLCGNGGSAGNAMHLANDFLYGIAKPEGRGLRVTALSANASVLTCLANDEGYDKIYSLQLDVLGRPGDLLLALSGSGNSPNILHALDAARRIGMRSFAIVGYTGGKAKEKADVAIHFPVHDMQISEDLQLIVGHMIMQWLYSQYRAKA